MFDAIGNAAKSAWRWLINKIDPANIHRPGPDFNDIQGHLANVILAIVILTLFGLSSVLTSPMRAGDIFADFYNESRRSVSLEHFYAAIYTMTASTFAFVVATIGGYVTGLCAAVLARSKLTKLRIAGAGIFRLMEMLYVIPVVATMSLTIAFLTGKFSRDGLWIIAVFAISIAAIALGGYQVFETIYRSTVLPKEADRLLVRSLYTPYSPTGLFGPAARQFVSANRLVDFSIRDFSNAIRRAFHLSVVAVVTLESIKPQLYELIFPQPGIVFQRFGGIGQVLLSAQSDASFPLIIVMILALLFFDFIAVGLISWYLNWKYLRHYGGQAT
jgi:hypothetical protein